MPGCVVAKQISEGALRIREEHLLPWQDDLESIKPRIPNFNRQDMQLACSPEDEITSDQLDWDCERYSKMAIYRARISEMIRCLLERTRPANHKRSRDQAEREERRRGSNNRRGDRSIADIVVVLTNASYPRFGVRAYNLCALLAGKYLKLDLRGVREGVPKGTNRRIPARPVTKPRRFDIAGHIPVERWSNQWNHGGGNAPGIRGFPSL